MTVKKRKGAGWAGLPEVLVFLFLAVVIAVLIGSIIDRFIMPPPPKAPATPAVTAPTTISTISSGSGVFFDIDGELLWAASETEAKAEKELKLQIPKNPPPGKIIVGPYTYTVGYHRFGPMGRTTPSLGTISLNVNQSFSQMQDTLLHEVLHTTLYIGTAREYMGKGNEDEFIEATTPTLLQVLRDNPELVKWWAEGRGK